MSERSQDLIDHYSGRLLRASGYARTGFAAGYDSHRPSPPVALLDILCLEAQVERPQLVVDLGSGTGLSTRAWAERTTEAVGIEASPEMRAQAEAATSQSNVRYVHAYAQETGLPDEVADIVTCSQSFHWMEPAPTLAEAARLLRPGGVFAAYDYDVPVLVHPEIDAAYAEYLARRRRLRDDHRVEAGWTRMPKVGHLERIRESGHFGYAREAVFHDEADVGADDVIGFAHSLGLVPELRALGVSEEELGLTRLAEVTRQVLGTGRARWVIGYRVRLGVKPS